MRQPRSLRGAPQACCLFVVCLSLLLLVRGDEGVGAVGKVVREGKLLVETVGENVKEGGQERANFVAGLDGGGAESTGSGGLMDALISSACMILVTEIGDETFIVAALLAMRHSRSIVLAGALGALVVMTVLSTALGFVLPNIISKKQTNRAATVLYTFFGLRLLYIAWKSKAGPNQEEFEEVEDKLEADQKTKSRVRRFFSRFCTPVFLESFVLTFLAEWGDRSQIATIALASHKNPFGVTFGAIAGHTVCTSLAVVGGRLLAMKISQRAVATIGGLLFLGFALHAHLYPPLDA